jgi:hypothetical protein
LPPSGKKFSELPRVEGGRPDFFPRPRDVKKDFKRDEKKVDFKKD